MAEVLCPVMVGRQAELGALDDALAGAGWMVFVTGEPGIGKSRLARELASRARAAGAMVISGRAVPSGSSTPYRPLTEALLAALRDLRPRDLQPRDLQPRDLQLGDLQLGDRPSDDADLRTWLPALSAILPGVTRLVGPAATSPAATGDGGPDGGVASEPSTVIRGEAVLRLLRWLARPGGLMVVLKDLHWADPDTLAVLEYLGDNLGALPVLVLATSRDEPATEALGLARRLQARQAAGHLPLDRLSDRQVTTMVRACLPQAGEDVIARVQRTADGVPFLVEEVLASPGVPASFRETVQARLSAFDDAQRLVLAAAALLGRHFDWRLLGRVTGQPPDVVAAALERGVDQALISIQDGEFRFRHALTREAVAAAVLPPRRAALAASALAALEDAHPGLPGQHCDVGADLALQAGDPERAGILLCASGRESLRRGALATAVETLSRAAGLLGHAVRRGEAEEALVEALALAGRIEEAMAVGTALVERLRADPTAARRRAQIHVWLAHAAVAATRWPAARAQLDQATSLLAGSGNRDMLAEVMVLQADMAMAADELGRARALADSVLDMAEGPAEVRCHALEIVGRSERPRDLAAAQDAFERALAIAEAQALPFWQLRALHELGTIELYSHNGTGRLSQALQQAGEQTEHYATRALAAAGGDRMVEAFVWGAGRGMLALLRNDQASAISAFERSAAILREVPNAEPANFRGVWLLVLAATGDQRAAGNLEAAYESGLTAAFANRGLARYAAAILAGRAADAARAAELAEAAERELAGFPVWADLARMYAAEAALADGWGEPRRWLETARQAFAAHGIDRLAWRCEARLGGAVPPAWASLGVTAREADVLRLVGEGLANKEIASRLYLSPRTVEKHVESLLRKTGARSRTQLVALLAAGAGPAGEWPRGEPSPAAT